MTWPEAIAIIVVAYAIVALFVAYIIYKIEMKK